MTGRSPSGRAGRASPEPASSLGHSATIPNADPRGFTDWEHAPDVFDRDADAYCTMGVGCDEAGMCYAAAHGEPERCPRDPEAKAWEWLYAYSQRVWAEDPEDCDFSSDQMVDAYLAGTAQGTETRQGQDRETGLGAKHDGPVGNADAPKGRG